VVPLSWLTEARTRAGETSDCMTRIKGQNLGHVRRKSTILPLPRALEEISEKKQDTAGEDCSFLRQGGGAGGVDRIQKQSDL